MDNITDTAPAETSAQTFSPEKYAIAEAAADALTKDSLGSDFQRVIELYLDSHPDIQGRAKAEKKLKSKGLGLKAGRVIVGDIAFERAKAAGPLASDGRRAFRYRDDFGFPDACEFCSQALLDANASEGHALLDSLDTDDTNLPLFSCDDSQIVRLMSKVEEGKAIVRFNPIGDTAFWTELNERLAFIKYNDAGEGAHKAVPRDVATQIYEQGYRSLPQAPEVVYTPLFLSDGTLLAKDGYHSAENLLLVSNGLRVEVPPEPSAQEVEHARDWIIDELLSDFPFLDTDSSGNWRAEPSLANALAMLFTPFMRRMIHGRTPVFFVYKPQPGTGGTLLGQLPIWLFDGAAGSATRYSQNEEEMQKGLIAAARERPSHLFFDDVREFNNRELLRAITQENVAGRLLGASKNISVPNRFNWIATGNNTVILDEMRRRTVFIRLNAKMPDATERKFRHPDVSGVGYEQFVQQNRALAIQSILTMIQYWLSTGAHPFTERKRPGFDDWVAKVGGVLQACAVPGFLDNYETKTADLDGAANRQFITRFHAAYNENNPQTANTLFDWAMREALDIITGVNEDQKRARFTKTSLVGMIDRTYTIGANNFMFQQTVDSEQNIGFQLVKLANENAEEKTA